MKETNRRSAAQRRAHQRKLRNRRIAMTVALVLVVALASIGGTIAWLTDKTDPVINTFTTADVDIDLTETWNADSNDEDNDNDHWEAKLVPGTSYAKDPKVTVNPGSEACYLFVHVEEANNTITGLNGTIVQYSVNATVWTAVPGHDGFYYREVAADAANNGVSYYVLTGGANANPNGQVTINSELTKAQEETIGSNTPTIKITAAAVQKDNVADVTAAWNKLPTDFTGNTATNP